MTSNFGLKFHPLNFDYKKYFRPIDAIPENFMPKQDFLTRILFWRMKKNMNTYILVVGSVRSGKSYFALKMAERISKILNMEFNVWKQCSFDVKPFLLWSINANRSTYVLDEVGCNLHPQDWFTIQSKIMRNFAQAQGFRCNIVFLVLPNVAFIQKNLRFLCNYVIQTGKTQGYVAVKTVLADHSLGKNWLRYIGTIKFSLPSEDTVGEYERMKKEWNDAHLKDDVDFMELLEQGETRSISKTELCLALNKGIIDEKEFRSRIKGFGYDKHDINILVDMNKAKEEPKTHHTGTSFYDPTPSAN